MPNLQARDSEHIFIIDWDIRCPRCLGKLWSFHLQQYLIHIGWVTSEAALEV